MNICPLIYDHKGRRWICPVCKIPTNPNYFCNRQLCRLPILRRCGTRTRSLTPEQLAQHEAARAEQEEAAKREAEALRPEGEKLGWDFGMVCRYAAALKKWLAAGRPTRTDKEVEAIEQICKACEKYESDSGRCRVCGCKITTPGIAILSKAKLATEKCPKGKW